MSSTNEQINSDSAVAAAVRQTDAFLLYKNKPNITPEISAESVNPGKYGPIGNIIAPRKSPIPASNPAHIGPYISAATAIGTKLNPILTIGVLIERKRDKIISAASSTPRVTMLLTSAAL